MEPLSSPLCRGTCLGQDGLPVQHLWVCNSSLPILRWQCFAAGFKPPEWQETRHIFHTRATPKIGKCSQNTNQFQDGNVRLTCSMLNRLNSTTHLHRVKHVVLVLNMSKLWPTDLGEATGQLIDRETREVVDEQYAARAWKSWGFFGVVRENTDFEKKWICLVFWAACDSSCTVMVKRC